MVVILAELSEFDDHPVSSNAGCAGHADGIAEHDAAKDAPDGPAAMAARRRRRWPAVVAAAVLLPLLLAGFGWFIWLPRFRPTLHAGERYGIDVSEHQGRIDWRRVARAHIRFAYIKATEGADFVDHQFASSWDAAGQAGVERGAYHFFTFCRAGAAQADNFLRTLAGRTQELAPAVDLELNGNCHLRPDQRTVERELNNFATAVESATKRTVVLYVGDGFERRYPIRARMARPLWHFRFLRRPNVKQWVIWQVDGFARVAGIKGRVDLDVMRNPGT